MRCRTEQISVGKILLMREHIRVDMPYQRGSDVWGLSQKRLFLDSVIRAYDTAKIYFRVEESYDCMRYSIIDGKQRLEVLWDFVNSKISLRNGGYESFCEYDKEMFKSKMLSIVKVENITTSKAGDMFLSLNTHGRI